ncbi:MAG TPA: YciI family protein [Actinomycetota bacterium]
MQPEWDAHARFMDRLHDSDRIILAGPYEDRSRVLLIVSCGSRDEAGHLFDDDPWTGMGVLEMDGVHAWEAFLRPPGWPA